MTQGAPAIVATDLSRRFGEAVAVAGVSFEVRRGEFFALLGPNGAGKSTTIHMLTTILAPTGGTAEVMGFDVVRQAYDVRRQLGMVFQDPALDERLTARENLEIHAVLYGVPRRSRRAAIEGALEWASLREVGDRRVRSFSGGMSAGIVPPLAVIATRLAAVPAAISHAPGRCRLTTMKATVSP